MTWHDVTVWIERIRDSRGYETSFQSEENGAVISRSVAFLFVLCISMGLSPNANPGDPIAGDVDHSGTVNAVDVQMVINTVVGISAISSANINYERITNAIDVQLVVNAVLGLIADGDADGLCDGAEANIGTNPALWDTDGDGVCDGQEMLDGSGPVEAACKTLVKARLGRSGMRWTRKGGQRILDLRTYVKSNRWDPFWNEYKKLFVAA